MWRAHSLEKTLMLEKIEVKRRRGQQRMRWLVSITVSVDMNWSKLQKILEDRGAWHAAVHRLQRVGHYLTTEQQLKAIYSFSQSLSRLVCPFFFFNRNRTKNPNIHIEPQKTFNSQSNSKKEQQSWKQHTSWLQALLQSYQNSILLVQEQTHRPME